MDMRLSVLCLAVIATVLAIGSLPAPIAQSESSQQAAPDNTKTNRRDRALDQPTADQQKENSVDRELTKKIRSALMQDKTLSTYAHNIKIITQNGEVTLKGAVRTQDEKDSIEAKAASIAGQGHVTNQLDVAPKKQ